MDDICDYLQQSGGGTTRRRQTKYTIQLRNEFIRLGWTPEFIHATFSRLTDDLLSEYPTHIFIMEWAKTMTRRMDTTLQRSIKESLNRLGLRPDIVEHLERVVTPLHGTSYTDVQVIDTAIFYLLGKYAPLTPPDTKHLIHIPSGDDTWTDYRHDADSKSIAICNISNRCSMSSMSRLNKAFSALRVPDGHTLYFHTTSWKGSLGIMKYVNRLVGRHCLDFGIFPGFYMSNTTRDCVGWGYAKSELWSNEVAIMVFCIPNILPSHVTYKELVGQEWVQVTSHSRQCKDDMDGKTMRTYASYTV